jgi:LCP family protein required for cell wall assembly
MNETNRIRNRSGYKLDKVGSILLVAFIALAIVTAVVAYRIIHNLVSGWSMTSLPGAPVTSSSGSNTTSSGGNIALQPAGGPAPKAWDGKSRVNILFFGLDYRNCDSNFNFSECDSNGASRTDSMILFTVDPSSNTAGMLTIPRDLWVDIPGGFGFNKINTAYFFGEAYKVPDGPTLAMQTVQDFLGVPIQYYVRIDFEAFMKVIDEIGGIQVIPDQDVVLKSETGYPKTYPAGVPVTFNGWYTLAFARNRHTENDDFDRSHRQQQVIMAIKKQVTRFDMLPTLISKAPALYNELSAGIHTNLTLDQALQLAVLVMSMPDQDITQAAITQNQVVAKRITDSTGAAADILVPIPEEIRLIRDSIFTSGGTTSPMASSMDQNSKLVGENARVQVVNGSNTSGLAEKTQTYLQSQGINVTQVGNASYMANCEIDVYNPKPYTLSYLANLFGVSSNDIVSKYDPTAEADIVVVLGDSWAASNPMQ